MKINRLRKVEALKATANTQKILPIYRLLNDMNTWFWLDGTLYDGSPLPPFSPKMTLISQRDASAMYAIWTKSPIEKIRINYGIID